MRLRPASFVVSAVRLARVGLVGASVAAGPGGFIAFAAASVGAASVLGGLGGCERSDAEPLPSVRLGMAPRDVRERFEPGGQGTWQSRVGTGDDTILEWTSHDPAARVPSARFEFHLGMLVGVRAKLAAESSKEHIETTARTVTSRTPAPGGGTDVTVLARDCPTHKDEADALVAKVH